MSNKFQDKIYNLLRRSEKYTKTDMVYLAKGEFWLVSSQIISSVATFLLAIAFANLLPKETYGTYKYILSVASLLAVSTLRGLEGPLSQAVAKNYDGDFLRILKIKMKYGVFGTLAGLGVALYYYLNDNTNFTIAFLIISVFLPFFEPFGIYHTYLVAKKRFRQSAIYASITQIITALLMIFTLFLISNIFVILSVYFISWTILRLSFLTKTIKKIPPNKKQESQTLSYGKHSTIINFMASIMDSLDSMMLFHYLGAVNLAIYSFSISPVTQFKGLFNKLPSLALPKLAKRSIDEIDKLFWKRFIFLSILGAIIAAIYIIIAPIIFKIFFPKYLDATIYSQIFSLSIIFTMSQLFTAPVLNSHITMIPKKMLYLWNIPGLLFISTAFILIHTMGIIGVIIGRLLSILATTIIGLIIWHKIKKIAYQKSSTPNTQV
jgi:O-antigen/teichoic acid export membrane protein